MMVGSWHFPSIIVVFSRSVALLQVEKKANVYMFLRDDHSQQHYKPGEKIQFFYKKNEKDHGNWCDGTFVRKCIGTDGAVKISYQHQQKDCEKNVDLKDVRPEESKQKKPAMCVYSRDPDSGRGGITVVERTLKALLRDAVGKASTG